MGPLEEHLSLSVPKWKTGEETPGIGGQRAPGTQLQGVWAHSEEFSLVPQTGPGVSGPGLTSYWGPGVDQPCWLVTAPA